MNLPTDEEIDHLPIAALSQLSSRLGCSGKFRDALTPRAARQVVKEAAKARRLDVDVSELGVVKLAGTVTNPEVVVMVKRLVARGFTAEEAVHELLKAGLAEIEKQALPDGAHRVRGLNFPE